MSIKYGFLCFLALCVVLLLIVKNYETWTQPIEWGPENVGKRPQSKPEDRPEGLLSLGAQKNPLAAKSYISISERNLFSPERKDFPTPVGNGRKQLVRPQILLYGVTISGNYEAASVASPGRPLHKGERETFTVKKGERIGEYKLVKILPDRITLEAQGDTFEVLLYDQSVAKKRTDIRTESKPATITSTQPGPSTPVPKAPAPTSPVPSTVTPKPAPPAGTVGDKVGTPAPPGPASPTLPRPDFPRRRMYYPPSAPSQKTEGN
jgi:hypothetical protein